MCQRGSSECVGPFTSQVIEVPIPTDPFEPQQEFTRQRQTNQSSQSKVNGRFFCGEAEPSHYLGGKFVIDVDVGARHTPMIHITCAKHCGVRCPAPPRRRRRRGG